MLCFRAGKAPKQIFVIKCGKDSSGTIAKTWKQPRCPSTDEWIKKMWHIYTMEYYSAIRRNEIEL